LRAPPFARFAVTTFVGFVSSHFVRLVLTTFVAFV